ncbi:hypothetical protein ACLBXB_20680 [Methylobacterium mesophilicum]
MDDVDFQSPPEITNAAVIYLNIDLMRWDARLLPVIVFRDEW